MQCLGKFPGVKGPEGGPYNVLRNENNGLLTTGTGGYSEGTALV